MSSSLRSLSYCTQLDEQSLDSRRLCTVEARLEATNSYVWDVIYQAACLLAAPAFDAHT